MQVAVRRNAITTIAITFVLGLENIALMFSHFIKSCWIPLTIIVDITNDMISKTQIILLPPFNSLYLDYRENKRRHFFSSGQFHECCLQIIMMACCIVPSSLVKARVSE